MNFFHAVEIPQKIIIFRYVKHVYSAYKIQNPQMFLLCIKQTPKPYLKASSLHFLANFLQDNNVFLNFISFLSTYLKPEHRIHLQTTVNVYWAFLLSQALFLGLCMIVILICSTILLLTLFHCTDQATDVQV